jgi:hypothetical protein
MGAIERVSTCVRGNDIEVRPFLQHYLNPNDLSNNLILH